MRHALIRRRDGQTDAGTAYNIALEQVKPGEVWRIRSVAYSNNSGESVTFTFGYMNAGVFQALTAADSVADGAADLVIVDHLLREGDAAAIQVKGSAKTGKVHFELTGELITPQPETVVVIQAKPPAGA